MAKPAAAARPRRKERKNIIAGVAHVAATFNNTVITITDAQGNAIAWSSAGSQGFKGSRKSTPYAAQVAAEDAGKKAREHGMETLGDRGQRSRVRTRKRPACVAGGRFLGFDHPRHDPDPAQWLPSAQAAARLNFHVRSDRTAPAGAVRPGTEPKGLGFDTVHGTSTAPDAVRKVLVV